MFRNRIRFLPLLPLCLLPLCLLGLTLGLLAVAAEITFWTVGYMYGVYAHLRGHHGD